VMTIRSLGRRATGAVIEPRLGALNRKFAFLQIRTPPAVGAAERRLDPVQLRPIDSTLPSGDHDTD
jgi:hypothetical protein